MNWKEEVEYFCDSLGVSLEVAEQKIKETGIFASKYFKAGDLQWVYFVAADLALGDIKNVLEIGTGYWEATAFLSVLIPAATIYTIDIKRKKQKFPVTGTNIVFIQRNSFFLPSMGLPGEFDLIYIDGGHWYPVVAWDAMFAYNRLREGGFMFMHDYVLGHKIDVARVFAYMNDIIGGDDSVLLPTSRENVPGHKIVCIRKRKEPGEGK